MATTLKLGSCASMHRKNLSRLAAVPLKATALAPLKLLPVIVTEVFDIIRRYLLYRGYNVKHVMNYTDVDDKIINKAKSSKQHALAAGLAHVPHLEIAAHVGRDAVEALGDDGSSWRAGHVPPYLRHGDGSVERLMHAGGLPLGLMEASQYKSATIDIKDGAAVVDVQLSDAPEDAGVVGKIPRNRPKSTSDAPTTTTPAQ